MGKIVSILMVIGTVLSAMDDPTPYKSKEVQEKKSISYLSMLSADIGLEVIPPFAMMERTPRDNRRDVVIERAQNLGKFVCLAVEEWRGQINEKPLVDATVAHLRAHPEQESHYNPNVFSVTSSLPFSQERLKASIISRMPEFCKLEKKDKNKVVVETIKACPFLEVIQPMIDGGATVHAQDAGTRATLLHYSVRDGDPKLVQFLIENNAHVDAADRLEATPVHYAVHTHNHAALKLLLERNAKPNLWDWAKNTALYYAVLHQDLESVKLLLAHDAVIYYNDVTEENDASSNDDIFEKNVLALAAAHNNIMLLKLLLEKRKGTQPFMDLLENMLNAALIMAASRGFHVVVDFLLGDIELLKTRPVIKPDLIIKGHSAIGYALLYDHYWVAHKILSSACTEHFSPHCAASRQDCLRIAVEKLCRLHPTTFAYEKKYKKLTLIKDLLLKEGADPVAGARPSAAFIAAKYGNILLLKQLLAYAQRKDILSPNKLMFEVAAAGSATGVRSLLEIPVLPTITDKLGDTPLHKAVLILDEQNVSMIDFLVAGGADIAAKNATREETPLHNAMRHVNKTDQEAVVKKIIEHLKKQNNLTKIDATNKEGNTPLMHICAIQRTAANVVQLLVNSGARVNKQNEKGQTALFIAANQGSREFVQVLLEAGADPNISNNDGCGPLTKAARNGDWAIISLLLKAHAKLDQYKHSMLREAAKGGHIKIIEWLLKYGADINGKSTSYGNTALHKAVQYRQYDTVTCLLEAGADVTAKNYKNDTPLDIATSLPDQECASLLYVWLHQKKKTINCHQ